MELLYIIYTHNRGMILAECLKTLFNNNPTPSRVCIIDDNSEFGTKGGLFRFAAENSKTFPIDFISLNQGIGYGCSAELGFALAQYWNARKVFFIESDYIFAPNGLNKVLDVFNSEIGQKALAFSGYDNKDFYDSDKVNNTFPRIIKEDGWEDNLNREIMYKPFDHNTAYGDIKLEHVSNSCGTMYFNWEMLQEIRIMFPTEYQYWLDKVLDKGKPKRLLNDGAMSHGACNLWNKYAITKGWDRNKYSALLNIKPSVANHINGGPTSINGHIVPEGSSFVSSPSWQ